MATKIEAHLIGFAGNLYGQTIELAFLDRLRAVQTFAGLDELKKQLHQDVRAATSVASNHT
jgi:riboflavin kinase/FMN adenylyltransferase